MIPTGELIWVSAQPLIRLFLCVAAGFVLTKAGFLPPVAARSAGQMILNVTAPSLMFSRVVPAFNSSNIGVLGPLTLVALLYEAIGIVMSWIIKQLFWVPHRFRHGILAAGGWGNIGDIPTSVLLSLTAAAPFNGTSDQNLAVAYISVFILIFLITLFPLGGANLVMMDFQGPDVIDGDVQEQLKTKQRLLGAAIERMVISLKRPFHQRKSEAGSSDYDDENAVTSTHRLSDPHLTELLEPKSEPAQAAPLYRRLARFGYRFFQTVISPCSLSIILAFIISIVPVLKALFVPDVPGVYMPTAPDGQPPLAIILDTTTFIGVGAISALAIARLVIMPVLGVLITQGLTQAGLLDAKDKLLRFVCIFFSCLPTATTQVSDFIGISSPVID
ncbi:auxin efflux carrier [Boletus reticuloceps]|uniref:Auxin efflux carrier n=1 Tax=Boletus reticuloceps TaxID=495285 RepID=A0A8I2YF55_9AGAM|nr:auxin efflux carrier [Boletus reticuloceps]